MIKMMSILFVWVVFAHCVSPVSSFLSAATVTTAVGESSTLAAATTKLASSVGAAPSATASGTTDDLLRPPYEIEPIATRIGHGFDIHRMAPLEEAGQPVVIAGVEIPHKDQKVRALIVETGGVKSKQNSLCACGVLCAVEFLSTPFSSSFVVTFPHS